MTEIQPTLEELERARLVFEENEPRDMAYRVSTRLMEGALRGGTDFSPAEAVGVLLQTWNRSFYRGRRFDRQHFEAIQRVIASRLPMLRALREERIEDLANDRQTELEQLFTEFEEIVGAVGAVKSLHLFAPRLFPPWDNPIAKDYGLALGKMGTNASRYWRFMQIAREQARGIGAQGYEGNPLKALDEYNYCRCTDKWV